MADELTNTRAILQRQTRDAQSAIQDLLNERDQFRQEMIDTQKYDFSNPDCLCANFSFLSLYSRPEKNQIAFPCSSDIQQKIMPWIVRLLFSLRAEKAKVALIIFSSFPGGVRWQGSYTVKLTSLISFDFVYFITYCLDFSALLSPSKIYRFFCPHWLFNAYPARCKRFCQC